MGNEYYTPTPGWLNYVQPNTLGVTGYSGTSAPSGLQSIIGAATPISAAAAAAPALVSGGLGILGGLLAPSMKKQLSWQREHLAKLAEMRVGMTDKYMKPKDAYVNLAGNGQMGQLGELLSRLLAGKAQMYNGQNAGNWGISFSDVFNNLKNPSATSTPRPVTGNSMPAWAGNVGRR